MFQFWYQCYVGASLLDYVIFLLNYDRNSLIKFSNGTTNLDGRCALENLRDTADFQIYLRVQIRLIVCRILTGNYRQGACIHIMTSSGVARFLRGWFLRWAFTVLSTLFTPLGHYLLAGHFAFLYTSSTGFRALKSPFTIFNPFFKNNSYFNSYYCLRYRIKFHLITSK